ncbi:hypothetical protein EYF80_061415 [Liparis tanakae]|uniref:Uncharacterized protein n=1 Tax=Liparis tanakae TaxID=230148 RepID=A0A4Z2EHN5_9TELE|nr:hypothetical protein EYF80_061415 [Liparis tanakae]
MTSSRPLPELLLLRPANVPVKEEEHVLPAEGGFVPVEVQRAPGEVGHAVIHRLSEEEEKPYEGSGEEEVRSVSSVLRPAGRRSGRRWSLYAPCSRVTVSVNGTPSTPRVTSVSPCHRVTVSVNGTPSAASRAASRVGSLVALLPPSGFSPVSRLLSFPIGPAVLSRLLSFPIGPAVLSRLLSFPIGPIHELKTASRTPRTDWWTLDMSRESREDLMTSH